MRLKWADISAYVPPRKGTITIRHCHTKPKLYITRKDDGTILAHCFHCGAGGGWKPKGTRDIGYIRDRLAGIEELTKRVVLPRDYNTDISIWPIEAYAWVRKYDITPLEVEKYGLGYSNSFSCVVIPIRNDGNLVGIQYRRIPSEQNVPKYVASTYFRGLFWHNNGGMRECVDSDMVFVVEDVLSAIKCSRICDAVALLGTNLSDACLRRIKDYKTYIVFLDNDNPQVLRNRNKIVARLQQFGTVKVVDRRDRDPKEYSTEELKDIMKPPRTEGQNASPEKGHANAGMMSRHNVQDKGP